MTWDYIAGFIDGEGTITKRTLGYNIYISQTNLEVLQEIRKFIGRGYVYPITKRKRHWKNAWLYSAGSSQSAYYILTKVADKLVVKKEEALLVLDELKNRLAERKKERKLKTERIRKSKLLRKKGWSYRKIGKVLHTDWGYIRRLVLFSK